MYYIISFCSKLNTGLCFEKKIISKIANFYLLISSLRILRILILFWFWFVYFSLASMTKSYKELANSFLI